MKVFILVLFYSALSVAGDFSPLGTWLVEDKDAKVELYMNEGILEGKVVWLDVPNEADGNLKRDKKNPDENLRNRSILNHVFLTGFKKEPSEDKWTGGSVYDAKSGKTYKGWIKVIDQNTMKLRGFVGISLFGRSEEWTRVSQ